MKLFEFVQKYINTKVDYDGVYGAQCVDLFRMFCKDVLQIPHTGSCASSGGAIDLFLDYSRMPLEQKYFSAIRTVKVKYGDVAIWGKTKSNQFGHVAIVISKIDKNILVFEQNGIAQDGAKLAVRTPENLLGVLRYKGEINE